MHFLQPEGKLKFYSRRYTGLDEDVLTEHMVGVGGVEGDVDGRDVVIGVTNHLSVTSSWSRTREVGSHNVLVTVVSSLRTFIWK